MNYLISTSRFKGRLLAIMLSCFVVGIFGTFSQNAFSEEKCVMVKKTVTTCIKIETICTPSGCVTVCTLTETTTIEVCELLADLISFNTIHSSDNTVSLKWETANEHDNVGFNIWRAQLENDDLTQIIKVNQQLIPSRSILEWTGTSYFAEDTTVTNGNIYYYVLEDIDNTGRSTLQCDHVSAASLGASFPDVSAIEKVKQICREYAEEQSE